MNLKINKKKLILGIILGTLIGSLFGVSYAFFNYARTGSNNKLITGDIWLHFKEKNEINVSNMFPSNTYNSSDYIEFTIDGTNQTSNKPIYYDISIVRGSAVTGKTRLQDKDLKFTLIRQIGNNAEETLVDAVSYNDFSTSLRIAVGTINAGDENVSHKFKLYVWISSDVQVYGGDVVEGAYNQSDWNNMFASVKVNVTGDFTPKAMAVSLKSRIESRLGQDGIVAVNTNGDLYDGTGTIREYRYSGSGRYCTYTDTVNDYNIQASGSTCPDKAYYMQGMGVISGSNDYATAMQSMVGSGVTELSLKSSGVVDTGLKNYIQFNNELYRIIGVIDGNIKIMKDIPLTSGSATYTNADNVTYNFKADTSSEIPGAVYGYYYSNYPKVVSDNSGDWSRFDYNPNDWTHSGAMYYLNENTGFFGTLSQTSKSKIETNATYYLGNVSINSSSYLIDGTAKQLRGQERGDTVCASDVTEWAQNSNCNVWNVWYRNSATWTGAVGLLYPSDFAYAASSSKWSTNVNTYYTNNVTADNWILNADSGYNWFLSPASSNHYAVAIFDVFGKVWQGSVHRNSAALRPVLNLKSGTLISSGDGSYSNPYIIA